MTPVNSVTDNLKVQFWKQITTGNVEATDNLISVTDNLKVQFWKQITTKQRVEGYIEKVWLIT